RSLSVCVLVGCSLPRRVGSGLVRGVVGDAVDVRIGARVMSLVCLARLGGVVPARVIRKRRQARRVMWDLAGIGAAVISELGAGRVASVSLTMAIGHGRGAGVGPLGGRQKRGVGRGLGRGVDVGEGGVW